MAATFTKLKFQRVIKPAAKWYDGRADAVTTTPLRRYHCGMTVGHGFYRHHTHTDPVGSACAVYGWFSDGRVAVHLPGGGCGLLGRADVEVTRWPNYVDTDTRAGWDGLPRVSRVADGEIQIDHAQPAVSA